MGCFASAGYRRLSSCESESRSPLLDSTSDLKFEKDYTGDCEDIRQKNEDLQRKMDEMRKKMDGIRKTMDEIRKNMEKITKKVANAEEKDSKNDMHDKTENEKMERTTATLKADIKKIKDQIKVFEGNLVNKIENVEKINAKAGNTNVTLDGEIKMLKDRIICLEVNSLHNPMEDMEKPTYYDELFSAIVILTFFVGFFLGMQI